MDEYNNRTGQRCRGARYWFVPMNSVVLSMAIVPLLLTASTSALFNGESHVHHSDLSHERIADDLSHFEQHEECELQWAAEFPAGDLTGPVAAVAWYDDGSGPSLYAAGSFRFASGERVNSIAKWDGTQWHALGIGLNAESNQLPIVSALHVFDDGSGPALFVGGDFHSAGTHAANGFASWDGERWVGYAMSQTTMQPYHVFDIADANDPNDPNGPSLYLAGQFGLRVLARWSQGGPIEPFGGAVPGGFGFGLTVHNDGNDESLYITGELPGLQNIARWDGKVLNTVGGGLNGVGRTLFSFDDGTGVSIYVGGHFTSAGDQSASALARWDGNLWHSVADFPSGSVVLALASRVLANDSSVMYVAGQFDSVDGIAATNVARWNDDTWSALGLHNSQWSTSEWIADLAFRQDSTLALGGSMRWVAGLDTANVALWDGHTWNPVGEVGNSPNNSILALRVFESAADVKPSLYVGGRFTSIAGVEAHRIARWDGIKWHAVGEGIPSSYVSGLTVFDAADGPSLSGVPQLIAAGLNSVWRWTGSEWTPLGGYVGGAIRNIDVLDIGDGPQLFVSGRLGYSSGHVIKWTGNEWIRMGEVFGGGMFNSDVRPLAVFDDGTGAKLYAGGNFATVGGTTVNGIAQWDGEAWQPVGSHSMTGSVWSMVTFDDGDGAKLIVSGLQGSIGDQQVNGWARWDGQAWSTMQAPSFTPILRAMRVVNDGSGKQVLYAVGSETGALRFDGETWSLEAILGDPASGDSHARGTSLAVFDDGSGPAMFVGGNFREFNGDPLHHLEKLSMCAIPSDLNYDNHVNVSDLLILLAHWGYCQDSKDCSADLNSDGIVDVSDLLILLSNWG